MDTRTFSDWLSIADIEITVRRMAGGEVCLSHDWIINPFMIGHGDGLGTWRVSGTIVSPVGEQPWSLVLKGWSTKGKSGSPSNFNWPRREAEFYSDGVLGDLPVRDPHTSTRCAGRLFTHLG